MVLAAQPVPTAVIGGFCPLLVQRVAPPSSIVTADFNGDHRADLASGIENGGAAVLLQRSTHRFVAADYSPVSARAAAVADLDENGGPT